MGKTCGEGPEVWDSIGVDLELFNAKEPLLGTDQGADKPWVSRFSA